VTQRLIHVPSGEVISSRIGWARTPVERARGLLGRPPLGPDEALVLERASQVHTFGMRYPIAVVFCDASWSVLHMIPSLRPWRISRWVRGARVTIELPIDRTIQIQVGDRLAIESSD
jgi:uncharacterized protein